MLKHFVIGSVTLATLVVGPGQLRAQEGAVEVFFETYYDSTYSSYMGHVSINYCTYWGGVNGVQYRLTGTRTNYSDTQIVGYCWQGDFYSN